LAFTTALKVFSASRGLPVLYSADRDSRATRDPALRPAAWLRQRAKAARDRISPRVRRPAPVHPRCLGLLVLQPVADRGPLQVFYGRLILFETQLCKAGDLPGFGVVWILCGNGLSFFGGFGKLFLLQELIGVGSVASAHCVYYGLHRLHIN